LQVSDADMADLLSVDRDGWRQAVPQIREHFAKFGDRLPVELLEQLDGLEKALAEG
ncbi:MAG: phosphoenolpyruvate carboxykinase (GTP), partial [Actinobacteria bacterium]|nr:phosphoenolpyruvate carboxykinase (GTP) [Actinomycetota bacterium]